MRVSTTDDRQTVDLQRDALVATGVDHRHLHTDKASGARDDRPGLKACLDYLNAGDTLIVWKLDRLGRSLPHLLTIVTDLKARGIAFRSLTEQMDTTTPHGELLFSLFGAFRFAPRIPNIAARRLHLFNGIEPGPDIAPLVAGRIDEGLIEAHWDDVLRLGTSIRTGVVSASIMLERLGSYPRANGLALALREIGRVERTLFTLDWIEQPEQRRRATRELNKGEAENALKRAIFFHRIGRIRDHALQAQSHRASALNLVAGAIVLWNTTYLQAARMHLANLGRPVPPDLLQHLSPLGWQHINLTGDYLWTDPDAPSTALRPLRQMRAVEGTAKP
jgi:hypothetical protein